MVVIPAKAGTRFSTVPEADPWIPAFAGTTGSCDESQQAARLSQAAIAVHLLGQFLVYGLVGIHVAAALTHRIVRRNTILDRMLPVRPPG